MVKKNCTRNLESRWILTPLFVKFILNAWTPIQNRKVTKACKIILLQNDRSSFNNKTLIFVNDGNVQLLFVYLKS